MKKWIFVGVILLLSMSGVSAKDYYYSTDGLGTFSLSETNFDNPNPMVLVYHDDTWKDKVLYAEVFFSVESSGDQLSTEGYWHDGGGNSVFKNQGYEDSPINQKYITSHTYASYIHTDIYVKSGTADGTITIIMSNVSFTDYTISGALCGVDWIELYIRNNDGNYSLIDKNTSSTSYSFSITDNEDYKLVFSDGTEYEFICTGDIIYDYDVCQHCTINIYDNCANLLNGAFIVVYDENTGMNVVYSGYDNPITLTNVEVNTNDKLDIIWSTWLTGIQKTCFAQFDNPINLFDQLVHWNMDVNVYDNESNPIDNANINFNQDCIINGYPTRNKYTDSSGLATFTQCENDNADLTVSKDGYKTLSTSISGGWYNVYTSTYEVSVTLQASGSDDSSTWDLINDSINDTNATEIPDDIPDANGTPNDIQLYFRNTKGYRITEVNDTDDYVRCYYSVWCDDPVSMTLKFQESLNGYDWSDVYTYGYHPDNDSYGYFEINNSYFNDSTYSYRAYIYDYAYPFDDRYAYLNVVNVTNQSETHYENLTGYCMFMNTNKNGSIDYREDITCYAMIISDNASLRTVSLELYDNSTLIDHTNLTNSSFDDDIYGWELGHNYTLNHNYSLVLRGYDGSILDCDNVIAYNLVGNKLTIKVTDSFNHDLSNVYIFCEHYGSINTGYLNYGAFEGLPDGESGYKASKSGYRSGAWKTVNLTSENEVVTYQLTQEQIENSVSEVRMSDDSVKDLYYPFMYFLMIIILIGGLLHVVK